MQTQTIGDLPLQTWARDCKPEVSTRLEHSQGCSTDALGGSHESSPAVGSTAGAAGSGTQQRRTSDEAEAEEFLFINFASDEPAEGGGGHAGGEPKGTRLPLWRDANKLRPVCDIIVPGALKLAIDVEYTPG